MTARNTWAQGLERLLDDMAEAQLAATRSNEAALGQMVMVLNRIEQNLAQALSGEGSLQGSPPASQHRRSENG